MDVKEKVSPPRPVLPADSVSKTQLMLRIEQLEAQISWQDDVIKNKQEVIEKMRLHFSMLSKGLFRFSLVGKEDSDFFWNKFLDLLPEDHQNVIWGESGILNPDVVHTALIGALRMYGARLAEIESGKRKESDHG